MKAVRKLSKYTAALVKEGLRKHAAWVFETRKTIAERWQQQQEQRARPKSAIQQVTGWQIWFLVWPFSSDHDLYKGE